MKSELTLLTPLRAAPTSLRLSSLLRSVVAGDTALADDSKWLCWFSTAVAAAAVADSDAEGDAKVLLRKGGTSQQYFLLSYHPNKKCSFVQG